MYHTTYKTWLVVTNDEFMKNVSNKINQNECKKLEGNDEEVYAFEVTNGWVSVEKNAALAL